MYIRTREDAIENLAQILELPDRRDQIIQSTVRIMLCLEVEPRLFLADCQALLIEGGLDALRERRRLLVEAAENLTVGFIDESEDRLFEDIASALDALRFVEVVRQIFPGIRADRWQIARLILLYESGVREQIAEAVRGRDDAARVDRGREALETMIAALRPAWSDRLGAIRSACLETLKGLPNVDADQLHEEAEKLFELFAMSNDRAPELLEAIDADDATGATAQITQLRELASAAKSLQGPPPPTPGQTKEVA
ncbi:MAG TPA: hypothetical protein VMU54_20035 [Planctomycetota bacterium]|nr:hypothetical protein [Planctomycetota bacterium]